MSDRHNHGTAFDAASGEGWVRGDGSDQCPPAFPIKGNESSMIAHPPGGRYYDATIPEFCFTDSATAESAGFRVSTARAARTSVPGDGTHDCPPGFPIKGNASSMIAHTPSGRYFAATIPEICFATEEAAEADGYRISGGRGERENGGPGEHIDSGHDAEPGLAESSSSGNKSGGQPQPLAAPGSTTGASSSDGGASSQSDGSNGTGSANTEAADPPTAGSHAPDVTASSQLTEEPPGPASSGPTSPGQTDPSRSSGSSSTAAGPASGPAGNPSSQQGESASSDAGQPADPSGSSGSSLTSPSAASGAGGGTSSNTSAEQFHSLNAPGSSGGPVTGEPISSQQVGSSSAGGTNPEQTDPVRSSVSSTGASVSGGASQGQTRQSPSQQGGSTSSNAGQTDPFRSAGGSANGTQIGQPAASQPDRSAATAAGQPAGATTGGRSGQSQGSARPDSVRGCPSDFPIKGIERLKVIYTPGSRGYDSTTPDICFTTTEAAAAVGYGHFADGSAAPPTRSSISAAEGSGDGILVRVKRWWAGRSAS